MYEGKSRKIIKRMRDGGGGGGQLWLITLTSKHSKIKTSNNVIFYKNCQKLRF